MDIFTIQNVSIKFISNSSLTIIVLYLQYKMFLLNIKDASDVGVGLTIYNTKCFY